MIRYNVYVLFAIWWLSFKIKITISVKPRMCKILTFSWQKCNQLFNFLPNQPLKKWNWLCYMRQISQHKNIWPSIKWSHLSVRVCVAYCKSAVCTSKCVQPLYWSPIMHMWFISCLTTKWNESLYEHLTFCCTPVRRWLSILSSYQWWLMTSSFDSTKSEAKR